MSEASPCRLYLITPPRIELPAFADTLKQAFEGGDVAALQLRLKIDENTSAPDDDILRACEALMPVCHAHDVAFIVNDRPHIAVKTGADGVHVGEDDLPVKEVRALIGPDMTLGASCYGSRDRAMTAGEDGADYVAFGAFYPTTTKTPRGRPEPEILEWWSQTAVLPSVAIGGITPRNCGPLVRAGADFIAVVTGVWNHPDGAKAAVSAYNQAIRESIHENQR
ncbi:MAG: thiamine phosphate synthase [Alphaproteobacteria bacterium]|nr:thiamine phosphate synthase [Alphaproteobacteria bacterium]